MLHIGLVGDESTHALDLASLLTRRPQEGFLAAVVRPVREWSCEAVATVEDLVGKVDVAVITTRDGRDHARQALPLLEAGMRVFVDKPFATRVDDALAMLTMAQRSGGAVTSFSALRFAPEVAQFKGLPITALEASGPADPSSPNAGLAFYGCHVVEMALEILPMEGAVVERADEPAVRVLRVADGAVPVTLKLLEPGSPFRLEAELEGGGRVSTDVPVGPGYFDVAAERILSFLQGADGLPRHELVASVQLLAHLLE